MKRLLLIPVLALAMFASGCKSVSTAISPALVQSSVASSVRFGISKYPSARPAVTVGVEVICSQANGTNLAPAVIVAAIESSTFESLKTPEAVFIVQGIITAYTVAWNALGADAVNNSTAVKPYMQAICSGGTEGLGALKTSRSDYQWPHLK